MNFVGTSAGVMAGLFKSSMLGNVIETALLAFVGAVIGFATTQLLKYIFKKK